MRGAGHCSAWVLMAGISTESSNGNADVSREDFYVNAAVVLGGEVSGFWVTGTRDYYVTITQNYVYCLANWPFIL